jgi:uncharacterized membrane protein
MKMYKKLIFAVFLLLIIDVAAAAAIHGTIYNLDLEKQQDSIVIVNSTPKQTLVSKDGTYAFELPVGSYAVKAEYNEDTTTETITIKEEGTYVLDLILFPSFLEEKLLEEIEEPVLEDEYFKEPMAFYYITIIIAAIAIILAVYLVIRYKKVLKVMKTPEETAEEDVADEIYDFIKKNKRVLQKQIRKKFPSSEAKISLILKELEHKGKIEKIKKGRGNLIILKK